MLLKLEIGGVIMEKWVQMGKKVRTFVNPSTFSVAVKFLKEESQIPASARRPSKDLNVRMAPCQGSAIARRYGWTIAFSKDASILVYVDFVPAGVSGSPNIPEIYCNRRSMLAAPLSSAMISPDHLYRKTLW